MSWHREVGSQNQYARSIVKDSDSGSMPRNAWHLALLGVFAAGIISSNAPSLSATQPNMIQRGNR